MALGMGPRRQDTSQGRKRDPDRSRGDAGRVVARAEEEGGALQD